MRSAISALAFIVTGFLLGAIVFIGASLVLAWTGPTNAPPNGNVSAPINVGTTDQVKNAGLGVNSLAVFGNAILSGTSRYLNFGSTAGSSGYGFRDNAGTMEFKNSGGSWSAMLSALSSFSQIKFADGTTQTTAATSGISATTYASCSGAGGLDGSYIVGQGGGTGPCTATCPAGYFRTGCSSTYTTVTTYFPSNGGTGYYPSSAQPSGSNSCYCDAAAGTPTCYAYCAK